jgi:hypothetical protein
MPIAEKEFWHNIKLMGSVVSDESGNQISLTTDERLGIVNALGGPLSSSNPVVSKFQHENDLNAFRSGIRWRDPVDTVSETPPEDPEIGDRYLNSEDSKLYNCTTTGSWGSGETPEPNWTVFAIDSDEEWTYDSDTDSWVMKSSGSIPYATEIVPGKVKLSSDGATNSGEAVQGNDSRLIKGYFSETLTNPTGTVTITHGLGSLKLFVQGWSSGSEVSISATRNSTDPTNKLDIVINGTPASLDVNIIAIP